MGKLDGGRWELLDGVGFRDKEAGLRLMTGAASFWDFTEFLSENKAHEISKLSKQALLKTQENPPVSQCPTVHRASPHGRDAPGTVQHAAACLSVIDTQWTFLCVMFF